MSETGSDIFRAIAVRRAPDGDVLSRAASGDPVAFAETYRRYHSRIYGFCLSRLLCPEAAEDAAQETFVRLLSSALPSMSNPKAWLFTVARNVCVDIARRRRRETPDVIGEDAAGSAADAEHEALAARDGRDAMLALKRLRPRYRTALILREVHGLPVKEIAESFGIREGAAHTLISRSRDAFARVYAEVSGRPERCTDSIALLFKRDGAGLNGSERQRLQSHLAECEWCRAEERHGKRGALAGLLPLLAAPSGRPRNLLAQAVLSQQPVPEVLRDLLPHTPHFLRVAAQAAVPVLMAGAIVTGAVGDRPAAATGPRPDGSASRGTVSTTAAPADAVSRGPRAAGADVGDGRAASTDEDTGLEGRASGPRPSGDGGGTERGAGSAGPGSGAEYGSGPVAGDGGGEGGSGEVPAPRREAGPAPGTAGGTPAAPQAGSAEGGQEDPAAAGGSGQSGSGGDPGPAGPSSVAGTGAETGREPDR